MPPGDTNNEGAASILRAVGSLLVALSGGQATQAEEALSALQSPQPSPQRSPQPSPPSATPPASRGTTADPGADAAPRQARTPGGYPQPQGRAPSPAPSTPRPSDAPRSGSASELLDDVEFVLADARERAQAIIDESAERARELVRQERAALGPVTGIDPRAFDDLRQGLRGLVTEVRDIQQRLGRIEQLLRDQNERAALQASVTPSSSPFPLTPAEEPSYEAAPFPAVPYNDPQPPKSQAPASQTSEPHAAEARDEAPEHSELEPDYPATSTEYGFQYSDPHYSESQYSESQYAESTSDMASEYAAESEPPVEDDRQSPYIPAPAPPRTPFSVVPPQRREWTDSDETTAAAEEEPAPVAAAPDAYEPASPPPPTDYSGAYGGIGTSAELAPEPSGWGDERHEGTAPGGDTAGASIGSPLVTFLPSDGAITLRVAPVAGFQGLMRVQDALTRLPAIRNASVDAYSQGEARLRIELIDTSDSDEIAEGLARALGGPARVEDASEVNRELFIALR